MENNLNNLDKINNGYLINEINKVDNKKDKQNINMKISNEDPLYNKSEKNIDNTNKSIILNSLFKAVQENDIEEIESNLIKDNSNINELNSNGLSLLHLSVIKGNIQLVSKLLKFGANPNILSIPNKQTPLHLAYLSQESTRDNIINTLLSYNADENIMDLYDNKPSDYKNISNRKYLITPDKKNKTKNEDLYYNLNDININFFSTSDIKKKSSNKKDKDIPNLTNIKCNCIFTPKKYSNNNNLVNIKSNSYYNFNDLKDLDNNFNSIKRKENYINKDNNVINYNINNDIFNNNESIKDINIYENLDKIKEKKNNEEIKEDIKQTKDNNLYNSKEKNDKENENRENLETNILNDSLEESNENPKFKSKDLFVNFNDENMDELLKTIITNKRKSIAERSSAKKRNKSSLSINNNTILKNNIKLNNSNNSCTYISTQNQTSQKRISIKNKEKGNLINENNKNISEFKCNKNNFDNNNSNENIIQKINKNREIFKKWLLGLNLPEYYENFIENDIYNINQLLEISQNKETKLLFKYLKSILQTKKYGHIYRIICKLEIDINILDSKLVKFLEPNLELKNNNNNSCDLSISNGKNVICGGRNKNKEEKDLLKIFLNKNGLNKFYQNFYHNGFDIIEFVILQMYSKIPINDFILENHFHIYNINERKKVLDTLINETERINKYINSEEYLQNKNKIGYKYENFVLEKKNDIHIILKNDDKRCNLCSIF